MAQTLEPTQRPEQSATRWLHQFGSAVLAGALSAIVYALASAWRGLFPFGDRSRNINDLGQQFIPMHAYYRDVLTGQAHGNVLFNWSSGFGTQFLGDFMAYVGTPVSWIVVLFPRDRIDLALFAIACTHLFLAAALMSAYLRYIRPTGPVWLAVLAGVAYGTCAWALDDAIYMTDWLSGLTAFPLLLLLTEWVRRRAAAVPLIVSAVLIALAWTSHFYTVYMATIGTALVLITRVLTVRERSWQAEFWGLVRAGIAVVLGIAMAAPLLLPTYRAVKAATPSPTTPLVELPVLEFFSRLLPGSEGVGFSPSFGVSLVMLVLAVSLLINGRARWLDRIAWPVLIALTILSMRIYETYYAWHGFDSPNGSQYRQAFIVAGMVVIAGWISGSAGLRWPVAVLATLPVGALVWAVRDERFVTHGALVSAPIMLVIIVLTLGLRGLPSTFGPSVSGRVRGVSAGAAAVLLVASLAEGVAAGVALDEARSHVLSASRPWGQSHTQARDLVEQHDAWPQQRTEVLGPFTANASMLIGGEGSDYYTSTIPYSLSKTLIALGWGYSSYGRATTAPQSPVTRAIFSVGQTVHARPDESPTLSTQEAAPLVTIRPTAYASALPAPFGPQERAIGASIYTLPQVAKVQASDTVTVNDQLATEYRLSAGNGNPGEVTLTMSSCAPGSSLWLWAPKFVGQYSVNGAAPTVALSPHAVRPGIYTGMELRPVGTVGSDGKVALRVAFTGSARLPKAPIGCLDPTRLASAIDTLQTSVPTNVHVGTSSVTAQLPSGATGHVVIATTRIPGWRCGSTGGSLTRPDEVSGLVAVPISAGVTAVTCDFRPPGLLPGLAVGAAGLVALLVAAGGLVLLRRRRAV